MDRTEALLATLRAHMAFNGTAQLDSAQVEALGAALKIAPAELPALVAQLQLRTPPAIQLVWGGGLTVLPPPPPSGGNNITINAQGAYFAPGSAIAGGNAQGGAVTIGADINGVIGVLAVTIAGVATLRPTLQGEAATAAAQAEQVLKESPAPEAPPEVRQTWAENAKDGLTALLQAVPSVEALVNLGMTGVKLLGQG
jgi:hypothetical protein